MNLRVKRKVAAAKASPDMGGLAELIEPESRPRGFAPGEQIGVGHQRANLSSIGQRGGIPITIFDGFDKSSPITGRFVRINESRKTN